MTQTERVIAAARSYRGVCQVDFLGPDTVDGGPPITRLAARLFDAEQLGYSFECIGRRAKCKVFRLCDEPVVRSSPGTFEGDSGIRAAPPVPPPATVALDRPGQLFASEPQRPRSHWEGEAA